MMDAKILLSDIDNQELSEIEKQLLKGQKKVKVRDLYKGQVGTISGVVWGTSSGPKVEIALESGEEIGEYRDFGSKFEVLD